MNNGNLLVFFQETPNDFASIKAVLYCSEDGKIMVQSSNGKKPYKGNLLYNNENIPVVPNGNVYLKLLGQTNSLSQITFLYTEDTDLVSKNLELLKI